MHTLIKKKGFVLSFFSLYLTSRMHYPIFTIVLMWQKFPPSSLIDQVNYKMLQAESSDSLRLIKATCVPYWLPSRRNEKNLCWGSQLVHWVGCWDFEASSVALWKEKKACSSLLLVNSQCYQRQWCSCRVFWAAPLYLLTQSDTL